jgi:hypothetical protein
MRPEPLWLYRIRTWMHEDAAGLALAVAWAVYMGGMLYLAVAS